MANFRGVWTHVSGELSSHHVGHAGSSGKRKITARVWERVGLRSKGWKCMTGISGKDAGKSEVFFHHMMAGWLLDDEIARDCSESSVLFKNVQTTA